MPNRRAAASSTRRPSGTTSLPMPSPGITAILCLAMLASGKSDCRLATGGAQPARVVRLRLRGDSTPGSPHHRSELDFLARRRALPLASVVLVEEQRRVGLHGDPRAATDLVFELAGRPARVAQDEHRALGTPAMGHRVEDVEVCRERDLLTDHAASRPGVLRAVEHERAG